MFHPLDWMALVSNPSRPIPICGRGFAFNLPERTNWLYISLGITLFVSLMGYTSPCTCIAVLRFVS